MQYSYKKEDWFLGSIGSAEAVTAMKPATRNSFSVIQNGDEYTLIKFKPSETTPDHQLLHLRISKQGSGFVIMDSVDSDPYPSLDELVYKSQETNYYLPAKWVIQQQHLLDRLKKLKKDIASGALFTAEGGSTPVSHSTGPSHSNPSPQQSNPMPRSVAAPVAPKAPAKPSLEGKWLLMREKSDPMDEFLRCMKVPEFGIKMLRNLRAQQRISRLSDTELKIELITLKTSLIILKIDGSEFEFDSMEYDTKVKGRANWVQDNGTWKLVSVINAIGRKIGVPTTETTSRYLEGTELVTNIHIKADNGEFETTLKRYFEKD